MTVDAEYRRRLRKYADASTMSYSGADYTAVVFLPMDQESLQEQIVKIDELIKEAEDDQKWFWQRITGLQSKYLITQDIATIKSILTELNELYRASARADFKSVLESLRKKKADLQKLKGKNLLRPIVLGDVQTITISVHRDKFPVRTLGRVSPKSYVRAGRTIAGSLIFTVLNRQALHELLSASLNHYNTGVGVSGTDSGWPELSTVTVDQLPPFDITIIASNELGDNSSMAIYGVEIVNNGQTMSIEDMITESVMQFYCRDYDPLRPLDEQRALLKPGEDLYGAKTATGLLAERRKRRIGRLNPFV